MNAIVQFDLFEPIPDEIELLRLDFKAAIDACINSSHKVRKGIYAENGALKKRVTSLEERLAIIESNICQTK